MIAGNEITRRAFAGLLAAPTIAPVAMLADEKFEVTCVLVDPGCAQLIVSIQASSPATFADLTFDSVNSTLAVASILNQDTQQPLPGTGKTYPLTLVYEGTGGDVRPKGGLYESGKRAVLFFKVVGGSSDVAKAITVAQFLASSQVKLSFLLHGKKPTGPPIVFTTVEKTEGDMIVSEPCPPSSSSSPNSPQKATSQPNG